MFKTIYKFFHKNYHSRYRGIYRHSKKLFTLDLLLVFLALVLLFTGIFYFFWKPGIVDLVDLSLSFGNDRVRSGDEARLVIHYANRSKTTLSDVSLNLRLPAGFIIADKNITPENILYKNIIFKLPAVKPGEDGGAEINGWWWAEPNHEEKIVASFSYRPDTTRRQEQKLATFIAILPESILKDSLVVTSSSFPEYPLPFTYTLTNNGDRSVENIIIQFSPGKIVASQKNLTDIVLKPNETKTITGFVTPPPKTDRFSFTARATVSANGQLFQQLSEKQSVAIFSPQIFSQIRFLAPPAFAEPGQKLPIEIQWKKNGGVGLKNLKLRLAFTPGVVDLKATAKENNLKIDGNSLVADAANHSALTPGAEQISDTFTVRLLLLPSFSLAQEESYFSVKPTLEGEMTEVPSQTLSESGNSAKIPLATELSMKSEARYYTPEGDQLGRGPLPPVFGEITKYWIFVRVVNTTNPARDPVFEASLPPGVEFTGKQSVTVGPELKYEAANRKVLWSYRELPAHSLMGLYFEVAINPTPEMIGKTVPLLKNINFSATDAVVNKEFSLKNDSLDNVLNANDRGSSAGAQVGAR